jgi:hypothetical protein
MTELARDKLREAEFFLDLALVAGNEDRIRYYLSAFLSASRSTTFVLKRECGDEPGFEEWYSQKQETMRNDPLFRVLKEFRNHVIKRAPVTPSDGVVETSIEEGENEVSVEVVIESDTEYFFQTLPQDVHTEIPDRIQEQYLREYSFTPIKELCEEYLERLEGIIREWEERC